MLFILTPLSVFLKVVKWHSLLAVQQALFGHYHFWNYGHYRGRGIRISLINDPILSPFLKRLQIEQQRESDGMA